MTEQSEPLTGVKALMFDFYGTVVDMQGSLVKAITPYLEAKNYTAQPANRVVTWWRRTHFENSMIDGLLGRAHIPYREIGRQTVDYILTRAGIPHTMDEVRALVSEIERLEPFPDVIEALTHLKDAGFQLVILSNGDPDMLEAGVEFSRTEHLWTRVVSVAEAGAFKPHFSTYATGAKAVGLEPSEVLFVANHAFDCVGAKAAGMHTAFVDRRKRPFGNEYYPPTLVVDDFADLANTVVARVKG
ncbi:haloacid dehalogenase type II [Streptomyces sp. NPDC019937]|uniref:haloacid dehalogenase type II n=1 Tax=Streptomyces sp. NPDC019937 TaxID=3154787 RepID=UPI0033CA76E5